jgi:hypothetical protein
VPLYLKAGQPRKAVGACDELIRIGGRVPDAVFGDFLTALRKSGQDGRLQKVVADIPLKSRELAAAGYVALGDLYMDRGKGQKALVDGYLRTVLLFRDVKQCRAEALEKTISAMKYVRDPRGARLFEERLRKEFPGRTAREQG